MIIILKYRNINHIPLINYQNEIYISIKNITYKTK